MTMNISDTTKIEHMGRFLNNPKIIRALIGANLTRVGQVRACTIQDLLRIKHIGKKAIIKLVRTGLTNFNLTGVL